MRMASSVVSGGDGESPVPRRFTSPTGLSVTLPALSQKSAVEPRCRAKASPQKKTGANKSPEMTRTSLLFHNDNNSPSRRRNVTMSPPEQMMEAAGAKRRFVLMGANEGRWKAPMTPQLQIPSASPTGMNRTVSGSPLTDASSQCTEMLRWGGQNRARRGVKNVADYDPKTYSELLPVTLKMRKVEEMQTGVQPSVVVSELLAEREVAQSAKHGMLSSANSKAVKAVPLLELQQFLGEMNQLQERGRFMKRRWRRYGPFITSSAGGFITMVNEEDDSGADSHQGNDSGGELQSTSTKRRQEKNDLARAAIAAWREEMNSLQVIGDKSIDGVLLRNELKKSRAEVEKARHGATLPTLLALRNTAREEEEREKGEGENKFFSKIGCLYHEDISWGKENDVSQQTIVIPSNESTNGGSSDKKNDNMNKKNNDTAILDNITSNALRNLLYRGKNTTVYGLDPIRRSGKCKDKNQLLLKTTASSQSPVSILSLSMNSSSPHAVPGGGGMDPKEHSEFGIHSMHRSHKPLRVEYGVGEQSSLQFKSQVAQMRLDELRTGIQNGEDIRRTRELLFHLRPTRMELLNDSLKHSNENTRVILQKHRQYIFGKLNEMDTQERKQACLAYVDLLEESYRNEIAENSWPAVKNALQKARDLVTISPARCNMRSFLSLLKENFLIVHLVEPPLRDMLRQLARLFDLTKDQYKAAMTNAYNSLNTPQDYQVRFREIERTLVGITAPEEQRVRLTLHRCRFVLGGESVGVARVAASPVTERNRDLSEVSVRIKTESQVFFSTAVRARACSDEETFTWLASRRGASHVPLCSAGLLDQTFRLHLCETTEVEVQLLHNSLPLVSSKFCLADCNFNARRMALLWLRLEGEDGMEGEIKLGLTLLGDKSQKKNRVRN